MRCVIVAKVFLHSFKVAQRHHYHQSVTHLLPCGELAQDRELFRHVRKDKVEGHTPRRLTKFAERNSRCPVRFVRETLDFLFRAEVA